MPLTIIHTRAVGLMTTIEQDKPDHKVIAVATDDPEFDSYREARDMPRANASHKARAVSVTRPNNAISSLDRLASRCFKISVTVFLLSRQCPGNSRH